MQILFLDSVDSTQTYLKNLLQDKNTRLPIAVVSRIQTNGIGSRDNSWQGIEGNLFLSFAIELKELPEDLKLESASIYFAYLLKEILTDLDSKVWLKWPNDFYLKDKKIGGMITNVVSNTIVCGVGINLINSPENFDKLDIKISKNELLDKYFKSIEINVPWKKVFSKYKLEFLSNKNFFTHIVNRRVSLADAILNDDGSIEVNGERIFGLR
ncbi:biotin--[acetyl-CoA-carboxylase] ligase [Sulfurimonas sp.]|nr:biotin--[acetyl-CoA-carboxylase] ligase [Sulfurimonas sp.]